MEVAARTLQVRAPVLSRSRLVTVAIAVLLSGAMSGCSVPDVSFYADDAAVGADVAAEASGDDSTESGDDGGDDGGDGMGGDCGAAQCCGSIPCIGTCDQTNCQACINKCSGGQECCAKQSLTCKPLGSTCPP
jgi:hypothetical protein